MKGFISGILDMEKSHGAFMDGYNMDLIRVKE